MKQTKRIMSVVLCLVMLLAAVPVMQASAATTVQITYAGQVIDTFNGVSAIYRTGLNDNSDTTYSCAAFVKKYYNTVYHVDVWNLLTGKTPSAGSGSFSQTSSPEPGDIGYQTNSSGNGHWFIIKSVSGSTYIIIEQNWKWQSNGAYYCTKERQVTTSTSGFKAFRWSGKPSSNPNAPGIDYCYIDHTLTDKNSFRINCVVDPSAVAIDYVSLAVWSVGSQSDLRWYDTAQGGPHGTIYYCDVPFSNHDNGAKSFICDFYVYGTNGKSNTVRYCYDVDTVAPTVSNITFRHVSGGYTVSCNVSDNVGVSSVGFATWTPNNGQDDLLWQWVTPSGNTATCTIKASDHKNEDGLYITHVYAYDYMGNYSSKAAPDIYLGNYVLDVNGYLDGSNSSSLGNYGTFDIYFDGTQNRNDTNDYANLISCGTTFEIKDIKAKTGYTYNGVKSGVIKGTMNGPNTVVLNFTTNSSTLKIDPNGGTWSGSTSVQSFKQKYNTTKSIPVPTRSGYTFTGWTRSGTNGTLTSTTAAATYTYGATNNATDTITATWRCNHTSTKTVGVIEATCTAEGYTGDQVCVTCGQTISTGSTIGKKDHTLTTINQLDATCTAEGYTGDQYCTTCKQTVSTGTSIPINTSNHVNTTNVSATASTCTVKGFSAGVYCNDCKQYISGHQEQPLAAHTTELRNAREATCTAEGYTGDQYCTVCKQTISTGTAIGKKAHTLTTINQKAANCTEAGYTGDQYCTTCKQTISKGSATNALGHTAPDGNGNCTRCGAHIKDVTQPTQPTQPQPQPQPSGGCKYCGGTHTGPFGWLIQFFHNILAMFKR